VTEFVKYTKNCIIYFLHSSCSPQILGSIRSFGMGWFFQTDEGGWF